MKTTTSLTLLLAFVLGASHLLGPDDHSTELAQAQALDDAQAAEAARLRQHARIQRRCGPNAAWYELGDGNVQCTDKHGRKTVITAKVQP